MCSHSSFTLIDNMPNLADSHFVVDSTNHNSLGLQHHSSDINLLESSVFDNVHIQQQRTDVWET